MRFRDPFSRREAIRLLALAGSCAALAPARVFASPPLLRRPIPKSGEGIPIIGLGTWRTFDVGPSAVARKPIAETLATFVTLGGSVVDTSPMYGAAEEVLGAVASEQRIRDSLFVATKVWTDGRRAGIEQMERSARLLRGRHIDLVEVHNLVAAAIHLPALREWKQAGRIRYIGITHYERGSYGEVERLLRREPLDFLQINFSLIEPDAATRLLPLARDRGVAVIANRPFAEGALFERVHGRAVPPWAADFDCRSWAQLALKWIVSHPAVTCTIPATTNLDHLADNMHAGRGPLFDERTRRRLTELVG
jgi:diketogulonate reductase-like aldo/keto reductase